MRRPLVVVVLLTLVLAGCGGDSDDAESAVEPATTTTTTAAATGAADTNFTGEGSEAFCGLIRTYQEQRDEIGRSDLTNLKPLMSRADSALRDLVAAAPAEIKGDAEVVAAGFGRVVRVLEGVNYDATKLSPEAFAGLSTPEVEASTERIEVYSQKVCGITTTTSTVP